MLNNITISGRLTADPELRYTNTSKPVTSFTLAVDRDGKNAGTDFISCVAWNHTAEFVSKWFSKGGMAIVNGRLQMRNYEDKNGNKRTAAEVVANSVYFAGAKKSESAFEAMDEEPGELPF